MSIKPEDYKDEFLKEARRLLVEAKELLDRLNKDSSAKAQILEQLFTTFHNLKGTAATLRFDKIASVFGPMDEVISRAYKKDKDISEEHRKELLDRLDEIIPVLDKI